MNSHALELLLFAIAPLRGLLAHNAIDIDDDGDDDDDEKTKIELSLQSRAHWANSQILQIHARVPSVSVGIFQFSKMLTNLGVVKPVKSVLLSSRSLLLI